MGIAEQEVRTESDSGHRAHEAFARDSFLLVTLGGAELVLARNRQLVLGPGKPLALLVYLALSPGRLASRESLLDLLWSGVEPERSRHALRQAVWQLRQCLGEAALTGRDEIALNLPIASDHARFLRAAEQGGLEEAFALYGGSFLPAFAAPGGATFERWALRERDRLRSTFLRIADMLVQRKLVAGELSEARRLAELARQEAPRTEMPWRLLLTTLVTAGDFASAELEADALESWARLESHNLDPATRAVIALVRTREVRRPAISPAATLEAELSGREREFAGVLEAWEACGRGTAQHIQISAPAGLGKSRLLHEVETRLSAMGARVIHLRGNPGDRTVAYAFAAELARAIAGLPEAIGIEPSLWGALTSLHPALFSRLAPAHSSLAASDSVVPGTDEAFRRILAICEAVAAATEDRPLALLVDDVHWLDDPSFRILEGLLVRLRAAPLFCITTSRPNRERVPETGRTLRLELTPLGVQPVRGLLNSLGLLPANESWTEGFPAALRATTGGSPLQMLEVLKLALDRGVLILQHGHWRCPDPAALQGLLQGGETLRARVETLPRGEIRLLALLALIGRPLEPAGIADAACRDQDAVAGELEALDRKGLLNQGKGAYELAHDEVGVAALAVLSPEEIRAKHHKIGRALVDQARGDPILRARSARHLRLAGDRAAFAEQFGKAVRALRRGGDRRSLDTLAAEFLGSEAGATESRTLVKTLPLTLRAGLWNRARLAVAGGLAGGLILLAATWVRPVPPPAEATLVVLRRIDSVTVALGSVAVRSRAWPGGERLFIQGEQARFSDSMVARSALRPSISGDGNRWLFRAGAENSLGEDIYLRDRLGTRLVVTGPKDDTRPRWLPGGTRFAFLTGRFSPDGDDYDLAVMDLPSGAVRDLTPSREWEGGFAVSPDGMRIGFARRFRTPRVPEVCRIVVDGSTEQCVSLAGYAGVDVVGWIGNQDLLVAADDEVQRVLLQVDPVSGKRRLAFEGSVAEVVASPDGRWVACRCEPTGGTPDWYVFPASDPDNPRRLSWEGSGPVEGLAWQAAGWDSGQLDSIAIQVGEGRIQLDQSYRLSVSAYDANGDPVALRAGALHWSSSDSAIARIDPLSGELRTRRIGLVRITASVAGIRSASIVLPVVLPAAETSRSLLRAIWDSASLAEWRPYGEPTPALVRGPEGILGVSNNGDGSYLSGLHSALAYPASAGLGLEALLQAPVKQPQWQLQSIGFTSARRILFDSWDHRSLGPPLSRAYEGEACEFSYPSGEGWDAIHRIAMGAAASRRLAQVGDSLRDGRWHRIRVQIFSDGTCGFAVDGVPVWRSTEKIPLGPQYRIDLSGNSVRTFMLVGPLELWAGVRDDIDWSRLDK